jgi:hypothetical protein
MHCCRSRLVLVVAVMTVVVVVIMTVVVAVVVCTVAASPSRSPTERRCGESIDPSKSCQDIAHVHNGRYGMKTQTLTIPLSFSSKLYAPLSVAGKFTRVPHRVSKTIIILRKRVRVRDRHA